MTQGQTKQKITYLTFPRVNAAYDTY